MVGTFTENNIGRCQYNIIQDLKDLFFYDEHLIFRNFLNKNNTNKVSWKKLF